MERRLHNCVDEQAVIRDGHKPFRSTIEQRINAQAHTGDENAKALNHKLWQLRLARA